MNKILDDLIEDLRKEVAKSPFRKREFIPLIGAFLRVKRIEGDVNKLYARTEDFDMEDIDRAIISLDKSEIVGRNSPWWFKFYHVISSALTYGPLAAMGVRMLNNYLGGN